MKKNQVQGTYLLYHYLQNDLWKNDKEQFRGFVANLLTLGIWFPPSAYGVFPIALPHVVRDPGCRGDKRKGIADAWGSPNEDGYFRDDNSMIKGLVRSFPIKSDFPPYSNKRLGAGFVAAHVWPDTTRLALINSFWPNLVWLPSNIAKLTDVKGSFAQQLVQAISRKIYGAVTVPPQLRNFTKQAWEGLPEVPELTGHELPDVESLNFFDPPQRFFDYRLERIQFLSSALDAFANGKPLPEKVLSDRYKPGLEEGIVSEAAAGKLSQYLADYAKRVEVAITARSESMAIA